MGEYDTHNILPEFIHPTPFHLTLDIPDCHNPTGMCSVDNPLKDLVGQDETGPQVLEHSGAILGRHAIFAKLMQGLMQVHINGHCAVLCVEMASKRRRRALRHPRSSGRAIDGHDMSKCLQCA